MGGIKQKNSGGSLLVFVRKYSVVVICVSFHFLCIFLFFFHFLVCWFFLLFFTRYEKGQTRREATILDERIQNFPFSHL